MKHRASVDDDWRASTRREALEVFAWGPSQGDDLPSPTLPDDCSGKWHVRLYHQKSNLQNRIYVYAVHEPSDATVPTDEPYYFENLASARKRWRALAITLGLTKDELIALRERVESRKRNVFRQLSIEGIQGPKPRKPSPMIGRLIERARHPERPRPRSRFGYGDYRVLCRDGLLHVPHCGDDRVPPQWDGMKVSLYAAILQWLEENPDKPFPAACFKPELIEATP